MRQNALKIEFQKRGISLISLESEAKCWIVFLKGQKPIFSGFETTLPNLTSFYSPYKISPPHPTPFFDRQAFVFVNQQAIESISTIDL